MDRSPVNLGGNDIQGTSVEIRGVSSSAGIPATAVYSDGIYEGIGNNYDIERVELLRGPQGTLYGRSATSGVLAVYTRDPTFDGPGGNVSAEWGSYSLQHYTGAGSKNRFLQDTLQVNLGLFYYDYGGFQTSVTRVPGNQQTAYNVTVPPTLKGAELELLYQLTNNDRVGLSYAYLEPLWVDKPADFARDQPQEHRTVTPHTINANYEHRFDLPGGSTLSARADATFLSSRRLNNYTPTLLAQGASTYAYADSEVTGNINATWRASGGKYSVSGYVRNVSDHRRIIYQAQSLSPTVTVTAAETDPRTYGVVLSARF